MSRIRAHVIALSLVLSGIVLSLPARAQAPDTTEAVRKAILRLPYYGPFDLISFQESSGVVTLGGDVYVALLKKEAEEAVRGVAGVRDVVNRIQVLPVSLEDDRLRRVLFARIYSDTFLAKYGTPYGLIGFHPWGRGFRSRPVFAGARWRGAPFLGLEPAGRYAIHVIVSGGRVTLYGNVDNAVDRRKAEVDARGVLGVFAVENDIVVRDEAATPARGSGRAAVPAPADLKSGS